MRFAYESQWLGQEAIQQRLPLVADQLLHSLMSHRASCLKRPLILIGHCFGGLVIEKALLSAKLHQTNFPGIFDSIAGVVFLGTPHRGSSSQSKASLIATIASSVGYGEQSSLLKAVEQDSEVLTDLVYDFASTANATSIPLFCFFEQHKSDVAKLLKPKASLAWPTYKDLIVDERSGTIDGHPKLGLACDHFQINRFNNAEDANYRYVSDQLVQLVRAAPNRIARRAQASTNLQSHVDVQDQRDQACLQAIFITDPVDDMRTIESKKDRVMKNSSNWMTQDPAYEEWQRPNSEALLWLHGEPGKGKTMLAISLVSEISQRLHTGGNQAVLAYFFCDNKDDRRRTTTAVLRGLIYQILMQRPELCFYLRTQYEKQKEHLLNSPNTLQTLWRILRDIASDPSLNELYIVIDALDECDSESTEAFLALLVPEFIDDDTYKETDRTTGSNASVLKLLLTSRNEIAIRQQLAGALEISLEQNASHVNSAVQGFVDLKVKQLKKQKKYDDKLTAFVQERLLEKAEGTFLWAALACKELSKPAVRLMHTRTVLLKLPSGLMPLYDRILRQISNLEDAESRLHAEAILRVMVTVTRPLSLQEAALLADLPDDYHGEEEILEDYVDGLCGSMVEIRKGSVHFVHLSARDYLLSTKTIVSPDLSLEHEKIAVQCFRHLCADDAGNGASEWLTRRTSTHYNRLEYPTLFWLYHLKQASKSVAQEIRWDDPFFQPHSRLRAEWFNVYWERAHAEWEERPTDFAAIHLAAYADIDWLASALLEACPESAMNLTDSQSNTPLAWAAKMGSERVAAALVSSGADVAIKNKDGITALYLAAAHGYRAMVQMLAENGASVKVRDRLRWTPLHRAADLGNTEVVLCLLNNGADIEAKDGGTWTALYRAVSSGKLAVMKILLDHNANTDIPDREGMTLLHTAAWNGHKEIVLFLLSYAKDIDTRDREGWSAVHHAAWNGHGKVVDVLLLNKADANAKNNEGNTPLYNAAWNGHSAVIRSLVQNGARVNELCTGDETALQQAAYRGQTSAAQTLLDLGADPNARNALGATALHHAATNGQKAIMRLLLDAGADPLAKSKDGQTAYEAAKENSYYELARYIESRGGRVSEDDDSESGEDGMMERRIGLPVDPAITEMLQLSSEISTMQDHGDACSTDPFKITTTVGKGKRYYFVKIGPLEDMFKGKCIVRQRLKLYLIRMQRSMLRYKHFSRPYPPSAHSVTDLANCVSLRAISWPQTSSTSMTIRQMRLAAASHSHRSWQTCTRHQHLYPKGSSSPCSASG